MARRKAVYVKRPFESIGISSDTSANIYMSMLLSEAWRDLTANQQRLYLYCKAQYYAEKAKPNGDTLSFTMNQGKWCTLYGLYSKGNAGGFYKDIAALIDHGFVSCAECGKATRTKSIYRFSEKWQKYGTPEFAIDGNEKTSAMLRKSLLSLRETGTKVT